jgi:hypothetical protein
LLRRNEIHPGNLATSAFGQSPPTAQVHLSLRCQGRIASNPDSGSERIALLQPIQEFLLQAQLNFSLESPL